VSREVKALAWHVCHVSHSLPVSRRRSPREADTRHVGSSAICISHLHVYRAAVARRRKLGCCPANFVRAVLL